MPLKLSTYEMEQKEIISRGLEETTLETQILSAYRLILGDWKSNLFDVQSDEYWSDDQFLCIKKIKSYTGFCQSEINQK
ncbi:hypothetical protein X798_04591 [Onchocerca flexuosa]|uniref:Uncharacterized protein n=1 Tax=Onchocerca flexuosa TaxID=387005 RepID=A0A238BSR2_9BILA|nr:hypothetical protein X798_04591 [Onchocerca flexuosa]